MNYLNRVSVIVEFLQSMFIAQPYIRVYIIKAYDTLDFNCSFFLGYISSLPSMTEDQVREALCDHVSEQCCFGQSAAKEMVFNSLEATSAFHVSIY